MVGARAMGLRLVCGRRFAAVRSSRLPCTVSCTVGRMITHMLCGRVWSSVYCWSCFEADCEVLVLLSLVSLGRECQWRGGRGEERRVLMGFHSDHARCLERMAATRFWEIRTRMYWVCIRFLCHVIFSFAYQEALGGKRGMLISDVVLQKKFYRFRL